MASRAQQRCPWEVLGVPRGAKAKDIRDAFHKLSRRVRKLTSTRPAHHVSCGRELGSEPEAKAERGRRILPKFDAFKGRFVTYMTLLRGRQRPVTPRTHPARSSTLTWPRGTRSASRRSRRLTPSSPPGPRGPRRGRGPGPPARARGPGRGGAGATTGHPTRGSGGGRIRGRRGGGRGCSPTSSCGSRSCPCPPRLRPGGCGG